MSAANSLLARGDRVLRALAGDVLTITKANVEHSITAIVTFDVTDDQSGFVAQQVKQASRLMFARAGAGFTPVAGDVFTDEDDLMHTVTAVRRMGPNWECDCTVNS